MINGLRLAMMAGLCSILSPAPRAAVADEADALRSYQSANGLLNRGLYELAAAEYRKFLSAPTDAEKETIARYGLAVCLFRTRDYAGARQELAPIVEQRFSFAAETRAMLGQCQLALGEYQDAAKTLELFCRRYEDHDLCDDCAALWVEALYRAGAHDEAVRRGAQFAQRWPQGPLAERVAFFHALAELAQQHYDVAAPLFERLIQTKTDEALAAQAALHLAQCHHHSGALDQAERWYRATLDRNDETLTPDALLGLSAILQARGDGAEAGKLLDRLLGLQPDGRLTPAARLNRGRVWFDAQRYDEARELFELAQRDPALADQAAYWLAKCLLRQERFADAAARLADAMKEHPESPLTAEMRYDRALALQRDGQAEAARAALETFLEKHAKHALAPDALCLLARIQHDARQFEPCVAHCDRFLKAHADHELAPAVAFLAAESESLSGRHEQALRRFDAFARDYPSDARHAAARFRAAVALYKLQRLDQAAERLNELVEQPELDRSMSFAYLALGDIAFGRGEWQRAEQRLGQYLSAGEDQPGADDARLKLGLALQRQGRHELALRAFRDLIQKSPQSEHATHALFEQAQALLALERPDEARQAFELTLEQDADGRFRAFALSHLGALAAARGEMDEAARRFEAALGASPDADTAAEAAFQRGQALAALQRHDEAEAAFRAFLKAHPGSARAAEARARLAIAIARQDRGADALKALDEALQQSDELGAALRNAALYERAWRLQELGRADEAAAAYRTLLEATFHPHAALALAELEARAKRWAPAADLLRDLLARVEKQPDLAPAEVLAKAGYRLGVCEFELGNHERAASLLGDFVDQHADDPLAGSAAFFCGEALLRLERAEAAAQRFEMALARFQPDDAAYAPSLLRLGEAQAALQRWARSEKTFTDYLDRFKDQGPWHQAQFGVGWARENQGRHEEAIRAYRDVVERHEGETAARAQFQIGECLFALNRHEDAARELLKVDILYAYPQWSAAALYEAGRCFEQLGKPVEARQQYQAVVAGHSGTRWAELAAAALQKLVGGGVPGRG